MPGNVRKLARASFNIRFILFRVAGWISSKFLSSSASLFAYRSKDRGVRDGIEGIRKAGEKRNRAANFLSKDYFPRAGN